MNLPRILIKKVALRLFWGDHPPKGGQAWTSADVTNRQNSDNIPIFYRRPRPVNAIADQYRSLLPIVDYGFARNTNSVVLGASEFPRAMGTYPIVFTSREPFAAVAVLGLEDNDNLFIDADGHWQEGHYVPAYVRRYPFVLHQRGEDNRLVLCVDDEAGLLSKGNERPLFQDGQPTQVVLDALAFCDDFNKQTIIAATFVAELAKRGLLVPNQARVVLASGQQIILHDFQVIDEDKFNGLPDDVFLEWRHRSWLQLVYAHLLSMQHWKDLANLQSKKQK